MASKSSKKTSSVKKKTKNGPVPPSTEEHEDASEEAPEEDEALQDPPETEIDAEDKFPDLEDVAVGAALPYDSDFEEPAIDTESEEEEAAYWVDGVCDYCGYYNIEEALCLFECSECGRSGCIDCMPAGNGHACPECEEDS